MNAPSPQQTRATVNGVGEGMMPPHDIETEAAVLSAVLVDEGALAKVAGTLKPEHFYSGPHRRVYEAALFVRDSGTPVDVATVAARLKATGRLSEVGGAAYLTTLLNAAPFVRNIEAYTAVLVDRSRRRAVISACQKTTALAYADPSLDLSAMVATLTADLSGAVAVPDDDGVIVWGKDLATELPPTEWICQGLGVTWGAPTVFAGPAYGGKSLVALDMMLAVTTGGLALQRWSCARGAALYLDWDGQGRRVTQRRLQRMARDRAVQLADLQLGYLEAPRWTLDEPGAEARLSRLLDGIRFAVIDSYAPAAPSIDEWKRPEVRRLNGVLERVSTATGCAIVVLDHTVKPPRDGKSTRSSMHDIHGSSAKAEGAQTLFVFRGGDEENPEREILNPKARPLETSALPPLAWRIEDVTIGDVARAGLRVTALDQEEAAQRRRRAQDAASARVDVAVLEFVKANPGCSGRRVREEVKGLGFSTDAKCAALERLASNGRIVNTGKANSAIWRVGEPAC